MKFKMLTILTFLLLGINITTAQKSDIEVIETFFNFFEENPIGAIDSVFSTSVSKIDSPGRTEYIKNEMKNTLDQIGNYRGYKIITRVNTSGEDGKILGCIVNYDKKPLRFIFIINKLNSKWQIDNFKFDENVDEEFEKAKKIANSKEKKIKF